MHVETSEDGERNEDSSEIELEGEAAIPKARNKVRNCHA